MTQNSLLKRISYLLAKLPSKRSSILLSFLGSILVVYFATKFWNDHQANQVNSVDLEVAERFGGGGTLMICGGGRLPNQLRAIFIKIAGGRQASVIVIPAYEATHRELIELEAWWKKQGVANVRVLHARNREEANQESFSEVIDHATGIWLTGGDQAVLASNYAGTIVEERIQKLIQRGGIVAGTSAGAAVMSKRMIEQGHDEAIESKGLDLLSDSIIDQHFLRRNRLQRMHDLLEKHPGITGFGIDEGTSLIVNVKNGRLIVFGDSYVCAVAPASQKQEPRFIIMKHGDECSLEGIKSGNEAISSRIDLKTLLSWE